MDFTGDPLKRRAAAIIGTLVCINVFLFVALYSLSAVYPALQSPGILAYTFGLRHAVDGT
jgi:high-affinity nickel permease